MAVGCSSLGAEENNDAQGMSQNPPFIRIPRPFNSPVVLPMKRPFEAEPPAVTFELPCAEVSGDSECSRPKRVKIDLQLQELKENIESLGEYLQKAPVVIKDTDSSQVESVQQPLNLRSPDASPTLEQAVEAAMQAFREAFAAYASEKAARGDDKASASAERWAAEKYDSLKVAMLDLLPFVGTLEGVEEGNYDVLSFHGHKETLEVAQRGSEAGRARAQEALCAVMAVAASREVKVWLEHKDMESEPSNARRRVAPQCKTKGSAKTKAASQDFLHRLVDERAGAFSASLTDPRSFHRVTFARRPDGIVPATFLTTRRLPLWDALETMGPNGVLKGAASRKAWCAASGREFAFQDLSFRHANATRKQNRYLAARNLRPDKQLRSLLRSKQPVIILDVLTALAPCDVCKQQGLSEIVRAELVALLRKAKANGEAVVINLGSSESAHKLAESVYLRSPIADYGMRCGCLRWRQSADVPWSRDIKGDEGMTLCLQMP